MKHIKFHLTNIHINSQVEKGNEWLCLQITVTNTRPKTDSENHTQ